MSDLVDKGGAGRHFPPLDLRPLAGVVAVVMVVCIICGVVSSL